MIIIKHVGTDACRTKPPHANARLALRRLQSHQLRRDPTLSPPDTRPPRCLLSICVRVAIRSFCIHWANSCARELKCNNPRNPLDRLPFDGRSKASFGKP
ncbi:hypothetical protein BD626DRAFT_493283 [Schizophyllum amplum]|uniref:Uncharacterized protein n=1 Tax=Schizophyllum amplum TaxID=97359 RepID=A0A550CGP1_9AGAR|nr:hypothetical protein BD626DRAFT_493283 [Auriculariopsis ampla]